MRLLTYDRGGARRLGAWVGATVIDLPDAVGHPVFPTTLEALVAWSGGTTLDAARQALEWPDVIEDCAVPRARLLVPLIPSVASSQSASPGNSHSDRFRDGRSHPHRPLLGPGARLQWPRRGFELDYELELGCVVSKGGRNLTQRQAAAAVFGYTLLASWYALPKGRRGGKGEYRGASVGPCVVTADGFDPAAATVTALVDGEARSVGFAEDGRSFPELIAELSRWSDLCPGDIIGSGTWPGGRGSDADRSLHPGAVVDVEAEGIGVLRTRLVNRRR